MKTTLKKLAVPAAALALCAGCASTAPRTLRLASYNIHHAAGRDGKVDFERIAAAISREKPDFVGLNEVDFNVPRTGSIDTAAEIGRLAGLQHSTFAKAIPYRGGEYGNAVLSKEKPLSAERIPLPGREPRVLLLCEFEDFWFGTVHMALQAKNQIASAKEIEKFIAERCGGKPVFITGDWNATPKSPTLGAMRGFMSVLSDEKTRTFHGFRNHPPESEYCIDYIAVDAKSAGRVAVREAYARPDSAASDHNPIVVALDLLPAP